MAIDIEPEPVHYSLVRIKKNDRVVGFHHDGEGWHVLIADESQVMAPLDPAEVVKMTDDYLDEMTEFHEGGKRPITLGTWLGRRVPSWQLDDCQRLVNRELAGRRAKGLVVRVPSAGGSVGWLRVSGDVLADDITFDPA